MHDWLVRCKCGCVLPWNWWVSPVQGVFPLCPQCFLDLLMIHINPDLDKTVAENECMIDCWGHDGLVVSMFALHYLGRGSNPAFSLYARSTCASSWFPPLGGVACPGISSSVTPCRICGMDEWRKLDNNVPGPEHYSLGFYILVNSISTINCTNCSM